MLRVVLGLVLVPELKLVRALVRALELLVVVGLWQPRQRRQAAGFAG